MSDFNQISDNHPNGPVNAYSLLDIVCCGSSSFPVFGSYPLSVVPNKAEKTVSMFYSHVVSDSVLII